MSLLGQTLGDYTNNYNQYSQKNNLQSPGTDLMSALFSGDMGSATQNVNNENQWMQSLSPEDRSNYLGLVDKDQNSGFHGFMSKLGPMLPLAILSGGLMSGGLGALGGGFAEGGGLGSIFGTGAEGASTFNNPAFTAFDAAQEGMMSGAFNNPAFVSIPGMEGGYLTAAGAGAAGAGGASSINDFFNGLTGGGPKTFDLPKTISSLAGLYSSAKATSNLGNLASQINGLYGPGSAFEEQLRKELARRDAAAGRRSQYGPRSVELQAKLAEMAGRQSGTLANIYQQQYKNRNDMMKDILDLTKGSGLLSLFGR